ncbi:MAG: hypothetical protein RLZZ440_1405 [Planctomycetota bacterium]|jgi:hypothetical protein
MTTAGAVRWLAVAVIVELGWLGLLAWLAWR